MFITNFVHASCIGPGPCNDTDDNTETAYVGIVIAGVLVGVAGYILYRSIKSDYVGQKNVSSLSIQPAYKQTEENQFTYGLQLRLSF